MRWVREEFRGPGFFYQAAGIHHRDPVGRLGEPEEIARCVVFLAADEAGFITGSTLSANGGQFVV